MDAEKIRVLVVDDDRYIVEAICVMLRRNNYAVQKAYNGREALERALSSKPDVIVLDVRMPVMNGIEACRILKTDKRTRDIPVIICTATDLEAARRGNIPADDFLLKPFLMADLLEKITCLAGGMPRQ